jgi:gamma-glutamyltranspeptidase / glutathione hydrolase
MAKPLPRTFPFLVLLLASACAAVAPRDDKPSPGTAEVDAGPSSGAPATGGLVIGFYEEAIEAGRAVLEEGGSASDAFVAVTLVEYVRAGGETSLAGPLGALSYDATTGEVHSLDASFDAVRDPEGLYDPAVPALGAAVLVPGALRGLEALWKRSGALSWPRLVAPARDLAAKGFVTDALFSATVASRREVLERSDYARALLLPGGEPIAPGVRLAQPELAAFLEDVARDGASAMYEGAWARDFAAVVRAHGGAATPSDLAKYEARWQAPWAIDVRGKRVFANAGRAYGGVYGLLGLATLAHDRRPAEDLAEVDRLETRIRTARALYDDPWFYRAERLDDSTFVQARLADTRAIWSRVEAKLPAEPAAAKGSHSLHVTVVDREGNAVTGTNTINSLPWGSGLFVRGVPLTDAGAMTMLVPGPGERVVTPLSLHAVTEDTTLRFIGGTFGASLLETELQVLADAVLEDALDAAAIARRRRFGTFPFDWERPDRFSDLGANWLDAEVPGEVVAELERRGLSVKQDPRGDTGWGTFVLRDRRGALGAAALDAPWFRADVTELVAVDGEADR